jgi:hypothetical protein
VIYNCCNEKRKAAVRGSAPPNGIDYLEVLDTLALEFSDAPPQQTLLIHCLNPLAPQTWQTSNVMITGGESITAIGIEWAAPASATTPAEPDVNEYLSSLPDLDNVIVVRTTLAGDFSTYTLFLVNNAVQAALDPFAVTEVLTGFDPQLAQVDFSFKVECPANFDCAPSVPNCPPNLPPPPPINYLAKDYGTFRTILLDRLNQLLPTWGGTSEADLGVTLAELMAYVGDYLSYRQDAVATEAFLETARRRVSLRRHALLVDYHVHDGCNSRVWMQLTVEPTARTGMPVAMDPATTKFYTTVPGMPKSLSGTANEEAALVLGVKIFEPMQAAELYYEHNQIEFYTWGDTGCCLPKGSTEATLKGSFENLQPGDVLVFAEVVGPQTGFAADADLRHRCAVRLTQVATRDGQGNRLQDTLFGGTPVPVTEIQWSEEDALPFPLCLSSNFIAADGTNTGVENVSVAWGNIVLADQGLTLSGVSLGSVPQPSLYWPPNPATDRCTPKPKAPVPVKFRPPVPDSPVTQAVPLPSAGLPVTPGLVALAGLGFVNLTDASGLVSLLVQADDPIDWPTMIGLVASKGSTAGTFDLSVYYVPPMPAGTPPQVQLESFTGLSVNSADANYVATQVTAQSQLIQITGVPAAAVPGSFAHAPTMFTGTGGLTLNDGTSAAFLQVQPTNPMGWPPLFGVITPVNLSTADGFNLMVYYNPVLGGVGVTPPILVGQYGPLTALTAAGAFGLVQVMSFAEAPNAGLSATALMTYDARQAVPAISLLGPNPTGGPLSRWTAVQDLLESGPLAPDFVMEVEADGTATLRFGDDANGYAPEGGDSFTASYRVGNGTAGNVGADILVNLLTANAEINGCNNPMPAVGGVDPETNDQIRIRAPQAFLTQERAVTMADYETLTEDDPAVDQAAATLRWTGSWYTAFVAVEPKGGGPLTPALEQQLDQELEPFRLAGQDLQLESPQYVSLELTLQICVDPDYFQADVEAGLLQVLSNGIRPNGQRGVFYPDNFGFGQTVYLSPIYAAARSVPGVTSVLATVFQAQGGDNTNEFLNAGEFKLGPFQVARLDNDRSEPDHGQLTLIMNGGKP